MLTLLGHLADGMPVVDRSSSHLHLDVVRLLPATLVRIQSAGRSFLVEEVDFGRPVGETICVTTKPGDQIVYAQRPRRFGLTRFVMGRCAEACSSVVVILKQDEGGGYYVLITAFIGQKAEPEPWDRNATEQSEAFWSSHALIWGSEPVVPGTVQPEQELVGAL